MLVTASTRRPRPGESPVSAGRSESAAVTAEAHPSKYQERQPEWRLTYAVKRSSCSTLPSGQIDVDEHSPLKASLTKRTLPTVSVYPGSQDRHRSEWHRSYSAPLERTSGGKKHADVRHLGLRNVAVWIADECTATEASLNDASGAWPGTTPVDGSCKVLPTFS
jgi:hypothetical protein